MLTRQFKYIVFTVGYSGEFTTPLYYQCRPLYNRLICPKMKKLDARIWKDHERNGKKQKQERTVVEIIQSKLHSKLSKQRKDANYKI